MTTIQAATLNDSGTHYIMVDRVRNQATGETGVVVKHCRKTVRVLLDGRGPGGERVYKLWQNIAFVEATPLVF
jgi:hypothetical protein